MRVRHRSRASMFGVFLAWALLPISHASTTIIPKNDPRIASVDLVKDGVPIGGADEADHLRLQGEKLDLLDPLPNDIWRRGKQASSDAIKHLYPDDGAVVDFIREIPSGNSEKNAKARVRFEDEKSERHFRLTMDLHIHSAMATAALLRKIGYQIPSPKHYKRLTIRFPDLEKREFFKKYFIAKIEIDPDKYILDEPEDQPTLTIQDIMLEPYRDEPLDQALSRAHPFGKVTPPLIFGVVPANRIHGLRALRALIVPLALMDIQQSINLYAWEMGKIYSESVVLNHTFAANFSATTYDDARWAARMIARLSTQDLREVAQAGQYPVAVEELLFQKILARRNNLIELFDLARELDRSDRKFAVNSRITIKPDVVKGKLLRERYDGYVMRFAFGDPEEPMTGGEIFRYLFSNGLNETIQRIAEKVNENLQIWEINDAFQKRQEELRQKFFEHVQNNPLERYNQPIGTWGGPTFGFGLSASRNVVTGTYYGADAPVQLVDNIAGRSSLGWFQGIDGIDNLIPGIGANVSIQRNYLHVRPIRAEIEELPNGELKTIKPLEQVLKEKWPKLLLPKFMYSLGRMLDQPDGVSAEEWIEGLDDQLKEFLATLEEGEMFVVTDSLNKNIDLSVTVPIASLLGLDPLSYVNNIQFGVGHQWVTFRRTTIRRTENGIQVYLQGLKSRALEFTFDINFWINVFHASYLTKKGKARSKVFHLDTDGLEDKELQMLMLALAPLFKSNNAEVIESEYPYFYLEHDLAAIIKRRKILWKNKSTISESHTLVVTPPEDPEGRYVAKDHQRTLYAYRKQRRTGNNYYSFLSEILGALNDELRFTTGAGGNNSAYSFFGNAKWTSVVTEGELTPGKESEPKSSIERHWGGWQVSRSKFFDIVDQLEESVEGMGLSYKLLDKREFQNMRSLKLYDVKSVLQVCEKGADRIRDRLKMSRHYAGTSYGVGTAAAELWALEGEKERKRFCLFNGRGPVWAEHRHSYHERLRRDERTAFIKNVRIDCVKPWMKDVLELRNEIARGRGGPKAKMMNTTKLLFLIEDNVKLTELLKWLGEGNFFFQVRINGFRTNSENALDKDGEHPEYFSNSIGMLDSMECPGVFSELSENYDILSHEVNARYFSEGF